MCRIYCKRAVPKAEIKIEGVKRLQDRLLRKYQVMTRYLDQALLQVCEDSVTYSKEHKGYKDRTSNLKNSMSFALFHDGQLIRMVEGKIPQPDVRQQGQNEVRANLEGYCSQPGVVAPKGYSLVIAAGMDYGKYVEAKGYSVVYMTKYYLVDELHKAIRDALEVAKEV